MQQFLGDTTWCSRNLIQFYVKHRSVGVGWGGGDFSLGFETDLNSGFHATIACCAVGNLWAPQFLSCFFDLGTVF